MKRKASSNFSVSRDEDERGCLHRLECLTSFEQLDFQFKQASLMKLLLDWLDV